MGPVRTDEFTRFSDLLTDQIRPCCRLCKDLCHEVAPFAESLLFRVSAVDEIFYLSRLK